MKDADNGAANAVQTIIEYLKYIDGNCEMCMFNIGCNVRRMQKQQSMCDFFDIEFYGD